jgi:FkbM family methyltransferase
MFDRIIFWKERGMDVNTIFDIGAHTGSWAREVMKIFPKAKLHAFEATMELADKLTDLSANIVLLGDTCKEVGFFRNMVGLHTGNSIYLEKTIYFSPETAIIEQRNMVRLDDYMKEHSLPIPDLIKLDTQGSELDILKGAPNLLGVSKYIIIETALHVYNQGSPMIEEVILFMRSYGYDIIDIVELHKMNGYLGQVDILFALSSTGLRKQDFYREGHLTFA